MRAAAAAGALMIAVTGSAAHAAPLLFNATLGDSSYKWSSDSDPTPFSTTKHQFGMWSDSMDMLVFDDESYHGYIQYFGNAHYESFWSGGIYTSSLTNPHFSIGTFDLFSNYARTALAGTLTISAPPTGPTGPGAPAPLVGGGLLSAFAALAALAMTRLLGRKTQLA